MRAFYSVLTRLVAWLKQASGKQYTPPEISAKVLQKLKDAANAARLDGQVLAGLGLDQGS